MSEAAGHKIAVVTGAGSGIGRSAALALVEAGFTVVLAGRRKEQLDQTASQGPKDRMLAVTTDISDAGAVEALFTTVARTFGRIDLLFNNAGANARRSFEELTVDDWNAVVAVNLTGTFLCSQAAFRLMKSQSPRGGRIINNGSIAADRPRPDSVPYTATKHGITGLTKAISLDGREYDIACGQIDIGNAATDGSYGRNSKGRAQADGTLAVEATMDVADIARTVVFMASLPLDANVQFLTVLATKMPYVGRG